MYNPPLYSVKANVGSGALLADIAIIVLPLIYCALPI